MIFRYPGGKARVVKTITQYVPQDIEEYREPCVGGGSLFFHLRLTLPDCEKFWINDAHPGLMAVYKALKNRPEEFIKLCKSIPAEQKDDPKTRKGKRGGKPKNARLKAIFEELKLNEECDQAFRYFFINRTVHGSGRVNYDIPSRLYFSHPPGWNVVKGDALERAAFAMKGVRITCGDYEPLLTNPGQGVFIYLDPPYVVNTGLAKSSQLYQFSFKEEDHVKLAKQVWSCPHRLMLSYDDDEKGMIRDLYPESDFFIKRLSWKYMGTGYGKKRTGRELLICNYEPRQLGGKGRNGEDKVAKEQAL